MKKVAVVTGSNQGTGLATVKQLCETFEGDVILTARDEQKGKTACTQLMAEGLPVKFHQLDICDQKSIASLRDFLQNQYGGLDVLVNNAGITIWPDEITSVAEEARVTLETNFWGMLNVCEVLFPLLRSGARDANKKLIGIGKDKWYYTDNFYNMYGFSKAGLCALTTLQQEMVDQDSTKEDIAINSCCTGPVVSSLSRFTGILTPEQGAEGPVFLATLPKDSAIRGLFWNEGKCGSWKNIPSDKIDFLLNFVQGVVKEHGRK